MSAQAIATLRELLERCESGDPDTAGPLLLEVAQATEADATAVARLADYDALMDAAIALLPEGMVWRKYTDRCVTVYGKSPYGEMQKRYDGYSAFTPLALAAAFLRWKLEPLLKAARSHQEQVS